MRRGFDMGRRHFAIIPAAGKSKRMQGPNKLLLPWHNGSIIQTVLQTWMDSQVTQVMVVIRSDDTELSAHLDEIKRRFTWNRLRILRPRTAPPGMKESVCCALSDLESAVIPRNEDRWLLAPADVPGMSTVVIDEVINASDTSDQIVAATYGDHQSHPVSFPWSLAAAVKALSPKTGINSLMADREVQQVRFPDSVYPGDIDTPAEYESALEANKNL